MRAGAAGPYLRSTVRPTAEHASLVKRCLLIVAIVLLAGAAVNLAVAWSFAIRVTPVSPSQAVLMLAGVYEGLDDAQWWWFQMKVGPGHEQIAWERPYVSKVPVSYSGDVVAETRDVIKLDLRSSWTGHGRVGGVRSYGVVSKNRKTWSGEFAAKFLAARSGAFASDRPPGQVDKDAIPGWAGDPQSIASGGRVRRAFGWPRVAMWHESLLAVNSRQQVVTAGGLRLADSLQIIGPGPILPYRIIPGGFAVNTLLYGAILWLLIPGPVALRRFSRVRRGVCPACAYPVGEAAVCTECGKARLLR